MADTKKCSVTGADYELNSFSDAVHSFIEADKQEEDAALNRLFAAPAVLLQWLDGLLFELETHTLEALKKQQLSLTLDRFGQKWIKVAVVLLNNKFLSEAKITFLRLYQLVRSQEVDRHERYHKGAILWWLARAYFDSGTIDHARNCFMLAMIEDIRTDTHEWRTLPARDWLVNKLQVDASTVDKIGSNAQAFLEKRGGWEPREPELVWLNIKPHRRRISRAPLEFIKSVAQEFLQMTQQKKDITAKEKGDRLEHLVSYLFASESGFEFLGSTSSPDSQNDLLIRNRHEDAAIASLGDYFIVECKNWDDPVDAASIREFAGKLHAAKVKSGILVSKKDTTGIKHPGRGARETISKEYLQDATAILVLNENHIIDVVAGKISLATVLLEQFEIVRFDIR